MTPLDVTLVVALVLSALATVMQVRLIRSAIGLAATSVILTVIMFRLDSPLAAVFELSVCAGLIPAIFISTIGLTGRTAPEDMAALRKSKFRRYWMLPVLMVIVLVAVTRVALPASMTTGAPAATTQAATGPAGSAAAETNQVKVIFWQRSLDLIGQVAVLLGGALGVVVLVKERKNEA
jgi:NADH-quinone oxidoreductase subunit J